MSPVHVTGVFLLYSGMSMLCIMVDMNTKIKQYLIFFASSLNIVSGFFFVDSIAKQYDRSNVSSAIGLWFFTASLVLWAAYLVTVGVTAMSHHKKK